MNYKSPRIVSKKPKCEEKISSLFFEIMLISEQRYIEMATRFNDENKLNAMTALSVLQEKCELLKLSFKELQEQEMLLKTSSANWIKFKEQIRQTSSQSSSISLNSFILNLLCPKSYDLDKKIDICTKFIDQLVENNDIGVDIDVYAKFIEIMKVYSVAGQEKLANFLSKYDQFIKNLKNFIENNNSNDSSELQLKNSITKLNELLSCGTAQRLVLGKNVITQKAKIVLEELNEKLSNMSSIQNKILGDTSFEASPFKYAEESVLRRNTQNFDQFNKLYEDGLVDLPMGFNKSLKKILNMLTLDNYRMEKSKYESENPSKLTVSSVLDITNQIEVIFREFKHSNSIHIPAIFAAVIKFMFDQIDEKCDELYLSFFATVVSTVLLSPSVNANAMKQILNYLNAQFIVKLPIVCVPNFVFVNLQKNNDASQNKKNFNKYEWKVFMFFAYLSGRCAASLNTMNHIENFLCSENCWQWINRFLEQFFVANFCEQNEQNETCKVMSKISIEDACQFLYTYLKYAGSALYLRYQFQFEKTLNFLFVKLTSNNLNTTQFKKLLKFLETALNEKYIPPLYFKNQDPYVIESLVFMKFINQSRLEVLQLGNSNAGGDFVQKIEAYKLDSLRGILNRLTTTEKSQQFVLSNFKEKILQSSQVSNDLLRFTLFKIVEGVLEDSQDDYFDVTDEGHPTKLARLTCLLCIEMKELTALLKAEFCRICPLTIPKKAEEGLTSTWEHRDDWMKRMIKILATYAVIIVQPEQVPFSLKDGWNWLARMINFFANKDFVPPFYTAIALETVLKIISPHLQNQYGDLFIEMLLTVRNQIMPRLSNEMELKESLNEFLNDFISSKGKKFIPLFKNKD